MAQLGTEQTKSVKVVASNQRDVLMIAPVVTLAFLSVLWAAAVVFAEIFARSGARIVAALRGAVPATTVALPIRRVRLSRAPTVHRQPMQARPPLRAAA